MTGTDSPGAATGLCGPLTAQAVSHKTRPACHSRGKPAKQRDRAAAITVPHERSDTHMLLILLEALGAGVILVLIVWWTMFSGRRNGERKDED